jgi:hypothetical protein
VVVFFLLGYFSWLPGLRQLLGATALATFHPAPELLSGQLSLCISKTTFRNLQTHEF